MKGKRIGRLSVLSAAVVAAALLFSPGNAGGAIFFAGEFNDKGEFVPDKDVKGPCFSVKYCTVSTEIAGGKARTKIEEDIVGIAKRTVNAVLIFPLPKGVGRHDAALGSDARAAKLGVKYLTAAEAQGIYEKIAKATGATKVLALADRPALMVSSFPLQLKNKITLALSHSVTDASGMLSYECPMPATDFALGPVARLSVNAAVRSDKPIRAMFSPTHDTSIERKGLNEAKVRVAADNWFGGGSFRLLYVADDAPLGLRVLAHRAEGETEGYFMVIGNPTGSAGKDKVIEKDVLFVLDTSGSMRGEKIGQARSAIEYCLKNLNEGDRFNIVTFGTEVKTFRSGLVARTGKALSDASDFIDGIVAVGRTNISGALSKGLAGKPVKGRPRIMIFLTDGTPTAGELVPENIIKQVPDLNSSKTRIFVMGVGHEVNAHLLDRLAEETEGSSEYVSPDEEIDVKVAALYNRLSNPFLTDVQIAFGDLMTDSVYPRKVPALFKGSQFMIAGRYRGGGKHTFTISGTLAGEPKKYTCTAALPGKTALDNDYVAPLWAARKIGFLLQEIRLHGENKEVITEIVRLSKKFGIVTEYTAFIAMSGKDMSEKEAYEEATKRMRNAHKVKAGAWAVRQAKNDQALQKAKGAAMPASAAYVDRRGEVKKVDNVKHAGRRVFYLRNGRWEEAEAPGERKVRKIKLFSKEYFKLVRGNAEFREAQSIGDNISINIGNERIVVEK